MMNAPEVPSPEVPPELYQRLADFRHRIRQFVRFSEEAARSFGIEPQQHQLLLAIKGLPSGTRPTVRNLANRLCLRHNSTVELVNGWRNTEPLCAAIVIRIAAKF